MLVIQIGKNISLIYSTVLADSKKAETKMMIIL